MVAARLVGFLTLLACAGCSGEKAITTPVHGTLTYKGKPLFEGIVSFHAIKIDPGLPNRTPQGSVDASGHYSLSTFKLDDGAVPGDYAVTVFNPPAPDAIDEYSKAAAAPKSAALPPIYADPQRTPLKATVSSPAAGGQQIDFELKD
jgi:hypothetical protein